KQGMSKEYVEQREGVYRVSGTRVSLDSIVYGFRNGDSPETIRQNYEVLTLEEVYGAIAFYLANQPDIDKYLVEHERLCAENRKAAEPLPAGLGERLERARAEMNVRRS